MAKVPSVDDYDYIQLIIHDIHSTPKGRMVARRRMPGIIKHGLGIYGGVCFSGVRGDIGVHEDFTTKNNYGNKTLKPILSTLTPCPRMSKAKFKVGQAMCLLENVDGTLDTSTPRTAAELQVERLRTEFGLTVKSAFEIEFNIRESKSKDYYGHVNQWSSTSVVEGCQNLLLDFIHELDERNIPVDTLQTEYGPGQYEMTLDVMEGIQGPDRTIAFKNIAKTFLKSRGCDACFMTRPDPVFASNNGFHFNHSLWTTSGENAFVDVSKPNKLSELGCHWLAGLLEHSRALTAFCSPTMNCYRRIGRPWAPTYGDWSLSGRLSSFRLKVEGGNNVYIESRLPTSAVNPYLAFICILAAGMDGIKRKLQLPKENDKSHLLPTTLDDAIKALEADTILTEAMGSKLVEYFIYSKRSFELLPFQEFEHLSEKEKIEKEQEFYFFNV